MPARLAAFLALALALAACEPPPPPDTGLTYRDILCREDPLACREVL